MSTLSQLINKVCDDLRRTDITAQVSDSVVLAIAHFDSGRWWFNESTNTFTTSASVTAYILPSNYIKTDFLEVTLPGNNAQEVRRRDYGTIRRMLEGNSPLGYPMYYAVRNQEIHLAYRPNTAYVVTHHYVKVLDPLTANGSNNWTTDGEELIRARAAKMTALRTLHDPDLASQFKPIEDEALSDMEDVNAKKTAAFEIKPS